MREVGLLSESAREAPGHSSGPQGEGSNADEVREPTKGAGKKGNSGPTLTSFILGRALRISEADVSLASGVVGNNLILGRLAAWV